MWVYLRLRRFACSVRWCLLNVGVSQTPPLRLLRPRKVFFSIEMRDTQSRPFDPPTLRPTDSSTRILGTQRHNSTNGMQTLLQGRRHPPHESAECLYTCFHCLQQKNDENKQQNKTNIHSAPVVAAAAASAAAVPVAASTYAAPTQRRSSPRRRRNP